jgi:hypothetical protein
MRLSLSYTLLQACEPRRAWPAAPSAEIGRRVAKETEDRSDQAASHQAARRRALVRAALRAAAERFDAGRRDAARLACIESDLREALRLGSCFRT